MDTHHIKATTDILEVIGAGPELRKIANTQGGEWAGPCPFCGGTKRFHVQPHAAGGGRWRCHDCANDRWLDIFDYVMRRDGIGFGESVRLLGGGAYPGRHSSAPMGIQRPPSGPPTMKWQTQATKLLFLWQEALWSPAGAMAREWLYSRGLREDTLRAWGIGYNPKTHFSQPEPFGLVPEKNEHGKAKMLVVSSGVVIPCRADGQLWYIKIRRVPGDQLYCRGCHNLVMQPGPCPLCQEDNPKYVQLKRPPNCGVGLLGADDLGRLPVAVLTEGELDALLLWQEARDLATVATLGSAGVRLDNNRWTPKLKAIPYILVVYDSDKAGRSGAQNVMATLPQARQVEALAVCPGDKDLTDYVVARGQLRDWLSYHLTRLGIRQRGSQAQSRLPAATGALS